MADPLKVQLVEERGETSIFIDAEITEEGALLLSGQDLGKVPEEFWGDSDYEYWLLIPAEQKDRVLLALLENQYKGNCRAVSEFREFLKARKIPCTFDSWV